MDDSYDYGAIPEGNEEEEEEEEEDEVYYSQPNIRDERQEYHGNGTLDYRGEAEDYHDNEMEGYADDGDDEEKSTAEDALQDLAQLEQLQEEAERMKALGNRHMASQEYTRAYNAYSAALQLSPVGPSSHVFLSNRAASLLSLKKYSAASVDARRAVALAPTFGKAHARLGQALYFLKDYEGAVSAYEEAVKYEPDNAVTWTYLTKAKAKFEKQKERALRRARGEEMSITEDSINPTVVNSIASDPNRTSALVSGGPMSSSRVRAAAASTMSTLPPEEVRTGVMGRQSQEKPSQPKPSFEVEQQEETQDEEDDPDFEEALRIQERANRYLSNKQYRQAIDEYSSALFLVPDDEGLSPELHIGRAHALNGSRRHESAKNDATMAIRINPTPEGFSTLAKSLFYLKDYEGALDAFERSMELLPPGEEPSVLDQAYLQKAREAALQMDPQKVREAQEKKNSVIPKLKPPRFVPREQVINSTPNLPPMPKAWPQQTPHSPSALVVGTEREVSILSESLGIKLNRGSDGVVRIISVTPVTPTSLIARDGDIFAGDILREAAGVDMRRPITNIMWADTVALIRIAPRPISLVVAEELSEAPPSVLEEMNRSEQPSSSEAPVFASSNSSTATPKYSDYVVDGSTRIDFSKVTYSPVVKPSPANGEEPVQDSVAAGYKREFNETNDLAGSLEPQTGSQIAESTDERASTTVATTTPSAKGVSTEAADEGDIAVDSNGQDENNGGENAEEWVARKEGDEEMESGADGKKMTSENSAQAISNQDEEILALHGEVLFEAAQPPSDGTPRYTRHEWTNERWLKTSGTRKLRHCGAVARLSRGRHFFSRDKYLPRTLAVFEEPNLILVLRAPKDVAEVKRLLGLPDRLDLAGGQPELFESFLVAESVIDPKTCKLRLSPLTTVTSVETTKGNESPRRFSCFELITPSETIMLSGIVTPDEDQQTQQVHKSHSEDRDFLETAAFEAAIGKALEVAHGPSHLDIENFQTDQGWKHQIVLGTLHSFVIAGNADMMAKALNAARASEASNESERNENGYIDPRIIDAADEGGRSALQYACARRASSIVAQLVAAGANCSLRSAPDLMAPAHLSAKNLDPKSLSTILASTNPRPDSNQLDSKGRTPMYVAAVEGRAVGGACDSISLEGCLASLEAWGGRFFVDSPREQMQMDHPFLFHPVHCAAYDWRAADASVILTHCKANYPFPDSGMSLSASFHYPLHTALISLRRQINLVRCGKSMNNFESDEMVTERALVGTLRVLLENGIEPNERIEGTSSDRGLSFFADYIGFSPLQILGVAALEATALKKDSPKMSFSITRNIGEVIAQAAEVMVQHGSRLSLDVPPEVRLSRKNSARSVSSEEVEGLPPMDRSQLKIDENSSIMEAFGGKEVLNRAIERWAQFDSVQSSGVLHLLRKKASLELNEAPGGSDERSCALCWSTFGTLMNRKQTCRITRRYVCDDCSSKRLIAGVDEFRISDGQFLFARTEASKLSVSRFDEQARRTQRMQIQPVSQSSPTPNQVASDRDSLFGGILEKATSFVTGESGSEEGGDMKLGELGSTLGKAHEALHERGDRLNSLGDKTSRLADQSRDFAQMAKELEQSQKGMFW